MIIDVIVSYYSTTTPTFTVRREVQFQAPPPINTFLCFGTWMKVAVNMVEYDVASGKYAVRCSASALSQIARLTEVYGFKKDDSKP